VTAGAQILVTSGILSLAVANHQRSTWVCRLLAETGLVFSRRSIPVRGAISPKWDGAKQVRPNRS